MLITGCEGFEGSSTVPSNSALNTVAVALGVALTILVAVVVFRPFSVPVVEAVVLVYIVPLALIFVGVTVAP